MFLLQGKSKLHRDKELSLKKCKKEAQDDIQNKMVGKFWFCARLKEKILAHSSFKRNRGDKRDKESLPRKRGESERVRVKLNVCARMCVESLCTCECVA